MSSSSDKSSVVNLETWREGRGAVEPGRSEYDDQLRELAKERNAVAEQRRLLDKERASFEEDLSVLEDQRRFLDSQREKIRLEAEELDAKREEAAQEQAAIVAQAAQRARVECALDDARKSLEKERLRLQSEMAGLLAPAAAKAMNGQAS